MMKARIIRSPSWVLLAVWGHMGCDDGAQTPAPMPDMADAYQMDADLMDASMADMQVSDAADARLEMPDAQPDAGESNGRPAGWREETHGKGNANYARVFPQDRVNRLDLTCTAADWARMQADLEALTGVNPVDVPERPTGGGGGGPDFDDLVAACDGLMEGAACEAPGAGIGQCENDGGVLFCLPDGAGREPDWGACLGQQEGAACLFPGYDEAICIDAGGRLGCVPTAWFEGGPGGPGGPDGDPDYAAASFWPRKPNYIACDVMFEGDRWTRVGVRYKGNSTLAFSTGATRKLPLRFKFDAFEDEHPEIDDQRFFGFNHLSTVNQFTDASFVRQKFAADLFRAAGVPAPQTAFYRIYIDHGEGPQYFGLYTVTEVPRKPMLKAQFESPDGALYECDGRGAEFNEFVEASFHRKTLKDSDDYSDVEAFIAALNRQTDPETWRMGLEATFDMDGFIRFLAMNQAMVNWDTYGALAHNYYIYGDPSDGGRLTWIPWDFDLSLEGSTDLSLRDVGPQWPLLVRLRDDPVYMARYRAVLAELLDDAFDLERMLAEIARLRMLIEPFVVGAEGEQPRYTALPEPAAFDDAHQRLAEHLRERVGALNRFLNR